MRKHLTTHLISATVIILKGITPKQNKKQKISHLDLVVHQMVLFDK